MPDFAKSRRLMVDTQLRTFDVTDLDVLEAVNAIPRELFVPQGREALAYIDKPIALDANDERTATRFLMPTMFLARLLQAARVRHGERALVVAAGTGYAPILLAILGAQVTAVESNVVLIARAKEAFRKLAGLYPTDSIQLLDGAIEKGAPSYAPFDLILVDGAFETKPDALLFQLNQGGRLIGIEGATRAGKAMIYQRSGDAFSGRPLFDAAASPLPEFRKEAAFVF